MIHAILHGLEQPGWCPRWLWHGLSWCSHGMVQAAVENP